MQWTKAKNAGQLQLNGITFDVDKSDSSFVSVTLSDVTGNKVRIRFESYTMHVEVPEKPKMAEKFAVKGVILGIPVSEVFESEYEANNRKDEIESGSRGEVNVAVSKELVEEDLPF